MRTSWVCVEVFPNVTVSSVEDAMNSAYFGRAMHEKPLVLGTGHSETVDPVDGSNSLIALSDTTKRWSLAQRRPLLWLLLLGCPRASSHRCCPRLGRIHTSKWLSRSRRPAASISLLSPHPRDRVFVPFCELRVSKRWLWNTVQ